MPDYGDPLTAPFWEGAWRHELLLQRCAACGMYQFYPRPYCLQCQSDEVSWVPASGAGTVYSQTTIELRISEEFDPPYVVALVELDEGPRLLTNVVNGATGIGSRVQLLWRERDGAPPLPLFEPARGTG